MIQFKLVLLYIAYVTVALWGFTRPQRAAGSQPKHVDLRGNMIVVFLVTVERKGNRLLYGIIFVLGHYRLPVMCNTGAV